MLDPFSCLAIATAIAQFLEFGGSVLSSVRELHRSGSPVAGIQRMQQQVHDFRTLCEELRAGKDGQEIGFISDSQRLLAVVSCCLQLSDQMLAVLDGLNVPADGGMLKDVKVARRLKKHNDQIEQFQKQLTERKIELGLEMMKTFGDKHSNLIRTVDDMVQRDRTMDTALTTRLLAIQKDLKTMLSSIRNTMTSDLSEGFRQYQVEAGRVSLTQRILQSFRYHTMFAREESVRPTHVHTFEWMHSPDSKFFRWLQNDESLFWISGKAGSGKSTMMKFLYESQQTRRGLHTWAAGKKLVISRHYFWKAGNIMQKSMRGLLLSLCYDIFRSCPDLLPVLAKEQWERWNLATGQAAHYCEDMNWSNSELMSLLTGIAQADVQSLGKDVRLCLFIDGLDEYEGRQDEYEAGHDELIHLVTALSRWPSIKLCISSRPWNVFTAAFPDEGAQFTLRLEDCNSKDIEEYVSDRLGKDLKLLAMQTHDARYAGFVDEIIAKAEGVFLWVYLVINELMKSLTNADDWATLQRRLHRIPQGLEPYLQRMFDTLHEFYTVESAQHFLVILHTPYEMDVLALSMLHPNDPMAAAMTTRPDSQDKRDVTILADRLTRRIKGYCRDLITIHDRRVRFLHRTVQDFLRKSSIMFTLKERAGVDFNFERTMCHQCSISFVLWLESDEGRDLNEDPHPSSMVCGFFHHASMLEHREGRTSSDLYDAFELSKKTLDVRSFICEPSKSVCELLSHLLRKTTLVAFMHMPYELENRLARSDSSRGKRPQPVALWAAVCYSAPTSLHGAHERWGRISDTSALLDPERSLFKIDTITILLSRGADVNSRFTGYWIGTTPTKTSVWERYLLLLQALSTTSAFQNDAARHKARWLEICGLLLKAGACTDRVPEESTLTSYFGQSDTQTLLSMRKTPTPHKRGHWWLSWLVG